MRLNPSQPEPPPPIAIPPSAARELIHDLRNRAQREWMQAEKSEVASDRKWHGARSAALVEAAEIIERLAGLCRR